jgi:uncharacterized membrane protein
MDYAIDANPPTSNGESHRHNVGRADRVLSALIGATSLLELRRFHGFGKAAAVTSGLMLLTRAVTGHSQVYEALGVSSAGLAEGAGIDIDASVTIMRPREEVFELWRDVTNLALIMRHIHSIEDVGGGVTHWVAEAPHGRMVEWDAQLINEHPGEYLAWQSLPDSEIENAGSVHFADAGAAGTEVHLKMRYRPGGAAAGFAVAKMLNPLTEAEVLEDLQRLKLVMEKGVDITIEGRPSSQDDW